VDYSEQSRTAKNGFAIKTLQIMGFHGRMETGKNNSAVDLSSTNPAS
jgi:hypothetical protein